MEVDFCTFRGGRAPNHAITDRSNHVIGRVGLIADIDGVAIRSRVQIDSSRDG